MITKRWSETVRIVEIEPLRGPGWALEAEAYKVAVVRGDGLPYGEPVLEISTHDYEANRRQTLHWVPCGIFEDPEAMADKVAEHLAEVLTAHPHRHENMDLWLDGTYGGAQQ